MPRDILVQMQQAVFEHAALRTGDGYFTERPQIFCFYMR